MKKQILLTAMLLITTTTACAQFNIKIGSGKTFRKDTIALAEERFQETMMLEIGKKCSKFYSYTKYVGDSVFAADIANNASQETMIEHAKQFADTSTILSYLCQKAECVFKGRRWIVWYSPEISSSEGPWKLFGLPGLILKAEDNRGHYLFTCTGMEQCHSYRPILFNGKDYEPVNRKAYNYHY